MYHGLQDIYLLEGLKKDVAESKHQRPGVLTQVMYDPTWKWEEIYIDFVVRLPQTWSKNYSICVIVDRFIKSIHFILFKYNFLVEYYARFYTLIPQ